MDLETDTVIPIVERTLGMSARGREHWCFEWAKWLWAQEIEIAVYQAKQRWASRPLRRFTRKRVNRPQRGSPGGGADERAKHTKHP